MFRGRSIRACVRDLSQRLARAYGIRESYTVGEISAVIDAWRMRLWHPEYAFALFATRAEFETLRGEVRRERSYEELRADVLRRNRQLPDLRLQSIALFARNRWYYLSETQSNVPLPDSFARAQPPSKPDARSAK